MLIRKYIISLSTLFSVLTFLSCSTTSRLKDGSLLLRKNKISIESDLKINNKSIITEQLHLLTQQEQNSYFLGIFPNKIWLYNLRYNKYQKDSTHYQIQSKFVEKPVIYRPDLTENSIHLMQNYLRNQGYFYAQVKVNERIKGKKVKVTYQIHPGKHYRIDEITNDITPKDIENVILSGASKTLLKKGAAYSNTILGEERNRLSQLIINNGYYKFTPDNITVELDTLSQDSLKGYEHENNINIKFSIQEPTNTGAFDRYKIGNVIIYPDFIDSADFRNDSLINMTINDHQFKYHQRYINPSILSKKIFIHPGNYYSQENYELTLKNLNELGLFKFVRILFIPQSNDTVVNKTLNVYILINPTEKFDYNTNVEVSGGDLYAIGTAANLTLVNKNFLKGANQLSATLSYGLELGRNSNLPTTYFRQMYLFSQNFGLNFRLIFPKFLLPVNQNRFSPNAFPRTAINFGFNSLLRTEYFTYRSVNANINYLWKETSTKSWNLRPLFVNTLSLTNISSSFQERLDSIPAIRNSYQETFILGEGIDFIINTEGKKLNKNAYLRIGLEESGLIMSGVNEIVQLSSTKKISYAQYIRMDIDAIQNIYYKESNIALRAYLGLGIPYGKSTVLPYLKQYFVGGAYSLRGWQPRVLGPGSYYNEAAQKSADNLFIDQAGDIKLELNAEYRFSLIRLFADAVRINGAVFGDAGNIWLAQKDPHLPGANFALSSLFQDIAISTGAGLRFDLGGFVIVRLDWAFPIKKPYILQDYGWVMHEVDFLNKQWRRENLNFNLAIGYPF